MELMTSILTGLWAAVAAFFGHLVAHDFVEIVPKLSRAIIRRATRSLPKAAHERYTEEWLADLDERPGVFAKLKHACGCVLCVPNIRKQYVRHVFSTPAIRFEVCGVGTIDGISWVTGRFICDAIQYKLKAQR
jgi:hypothetical protein